MYSDLDIIAYFITFTTYGTWLHGDERGSVDEAHRAHGALPAPPSPVREDATRQMMKWPPFTLDATARGVVDRTIREVCEHRKWNLKALNVRTNHVHVVVWTLDPATKVLSDLKAWCTRRLREAGCIEREREVWTEGGSKRKLFTEEGARNACEYTRTGQGADLPME
jgi:REP element-mobilizing transposase RayT